MSSYFQECCPWGSLSSLLESHGPVTSHPCCQNCLASWWFETLLYLQASKLLCPIFMGVDRRHKTLVEEMKDSWLLWVIAVAKVSAFVLVSWSFGSTYTQRALLLERSSEFREPKSFVMSSRVPALCSRKMLLSWTVSVPVFCSRGKHCLCISRLFAT